MNNIITKEQILEALLTIIDQKIEIAKQAIESAKESRDSDTKSSAGDKYETGREMMQLEIDKNTVQLSNALHLKEELMKIDRHKKYEKAEFGSLVTTSQGDYFLSIGIGKIMVNDINVFVISIVSPLGKAFLNKKRGDSVLFQNNEMAILDIN